MADWNIPRPFNRNDFFSRAEIFLAFVDLIDKVCGSHSTKKKNMALINCRECENQISTEASICPRCGAPQKTSSNVTAPPPMQRAQAERTESTVVQVAPDYENEKIREMEAFGWNLQNRQEIVHDGDSRGAPGSILFNPGTYVTKTTIHKYVKLHFVRSHSLPNLEEIKRLEAHYLSLIPPDLPKILPHGIFDILFWPLAVFYFFTYQSKKTAAEKKLPEIARQKAEILQKVASL